MINIDGLVTGIDTESIIKGLLDIQQQQMDRISARQSQAQQRRSAIQSLEAQVLSLRTQATKLSRASSSPFQSRSVQVSDESALIATAQSTAAPGLYSVTVNSLARSHQVASQGFADREGLITEGTLTLRSGSRPAVTITIDQSNNTLQGLADAINAAGGDVSASILQDGSSGTPYRLLLTSKGAGAASAITIENNLASSGGGAVQPVFDLDNPVQAATNASVTLGSGPGAIAVESATNEIQGLIDGVTLNLLQADPGKSLTVRVAANTKAGADAVQEFVDAFNSTMEFIAAVTSYNAETGERGLLLGDRTVLDIQLQLRAAVLDVVPGASPRANRLTAIGVTVDDKGGLVFNRSRLEDILRGSVEGVAAADVQRLFALDGVSTHPGVTFLLGSTRTQARPTPYQVDVTQAAERARLTATTALAETTVIDASNSSLALTLDNASITVQLAHGSYTRQELTDLVESTVNAHPDLLGRRITAGLTAGNELTLSSISYGSDSQVKINSGTVLADLGLTSGTEAIGVNVAGTFIVNGQTETATGRGRVLTGASNNPNTADLQVRVTLAAGQIVAGQEAELTVTRGIGARLDQVLGRMLDSVSGQFQGATRRFDETIDSLQKSIDRQQASFDRQRESLQRQFAAMEAAIAELNSSASLLSAQLAGLSNLGSQRS